MPVPIQSEQQPSSMATNTTTSANTGENTNNAINSSSNATMTNNQSQVSLPTINPVHSTPSKKKLMKKRLSRIAGFNFSSSDDQPFNNANNINDNFVDTSKSINSDDYIENSYSTTSITDPNVTTITSLNSHTNQNKFNVSTSSLANSVAASLHKLPYKSLHPNMSTQSVSNSLSKQEPPSISRSNSLNHNTKSLNLPSSNPSTSPNKANSRYLATNNDHTFQLTKQLQPSSIQPQSQKISHSQSSSFNNTLDDSSVHMNVGSTLTSATTLTPTILTTGTPIAPTTATVPTRVVSPSVLPQFNSISHSHHSNQTPSISTLNQTSNINSNNSNSKLLAPPTVLTPIYKTHSSSTQTSGSQFYNNNNANNSSILYSNHNNHSGIAPSISDTASTAVNTSTAASITNTRPKGTGLLQNAYRSSHTNQFHSTACNSKSKDGSSTSNNVPTTANSTGTPISASDNIICLDSKQHFISPNISNHFKSLQYQLQLGIKKRMEYLDHQNNDIMNDINKYSDELDNIYNQLKIQISDLDDYIQKLQSKKDGDIKTLQQHGLFENLNDLNMRIETVKSNMNSKKESLKMFDTKLNTLDKLKIKYENRERNKKNIAFIISMILLILFLLKIIIFKVL